MPGPDGWLLAPEGGAIRPNLYVAVVADVHLGYEWARGSGGDLIPAHSLAQILAKLERLFARFPARHLVVAGDLVESNVPCARTIRDVRALANWLGARGIRFTPLEGNHDRWLVLPETVPTWEVDGWTIAHGHRPIEAPRSISGHLHPGLGDGSAVWPCFLAGTERLILPAFSPNAAGGDVLTTRLATDEDLSPLRCLASTGEEILDFGPLGELIARTTGMPMKKAGGGKSRRRP